MGALDANNAFQDPKHCISMNYLNMHILCSRLPLLSEATMFKLSLLIEQLDYTPSPLLSGVLYLANDPGSQHLMGRVAPRNVPSLDLEYVREVIARSCLALRSLLGRARNSYAAYTYRRRSAQEDYMPFENWMETSSFCGLCLHQMTVRVAPGWRRGSSTFSSRLGEMCTLASSKPNAKILRSFCWMRGSSNGQSHSNSIEYIGKASAHRADTQPSPKPSEQPGGHSAVTQVLNHSQLAGGRSAITFVCRSPSSPGRLPTRVEPAGAGLGPGKKGQTELSPTAVGAPSSRTKPRMMPIKR